MSGPSVKPHSRDIDAPILLLILPIFLSSNSFGCSKFCLSKNRIKWKERQERRLKLEVTKIESVSCGGNVARETATYSAVSLRRTALQRVVQDIGWRSHPIQPQSILGASNFKRLSCRSFHLIPKRLCSIKTPI